MRHQMWRRLFVATIAAIAFGASASAQQFVQPAPGPTAITVPNTAATAVSLPTDTANPRLIGHGQVTAHVATATRGFVMQSTGQYAWSNCPNGANCNNGSGSLAADIGFVFGPSKSFFAPCGPRVLPDCGGKHGHGGNCRTPIYGHGPCGPWPQCGYDSYLNH